MNEKSKQEITKRMNRRIRLDNQPLFGSQDQSWSPDSGDDGNRAHGRM